MKHHHLTVILFALYAQNLPAAEQPQPEVWMAALHLPRDLIERENEWRDVLRRVDGFKFWSGQLDWNENGTPGNLVRLLHAWHVDIVSERMYWPPLKAEGQSRILAWSRRPSSCCLRTHTHHAPPLARFGLLVATGGRWKDKQLVAPGWLQGHAGLDIHVVAGDPQTMVSIAKTNTGGFPFGVDVGSSGNFAFPAHLIVGPVTR